MSGPAIEPDNKIVAIVDSRRSAAFIEDLVDVLYCCSVHSAYEMAFSANKRSLRARQYKQLISSPSRLFYGLLPCIFARRVHNLVIVRNEQEQTERLTWTEPAVMGNAPSGSSLVELYPSREYEHVRSLEPLCPAVYSREA